LSQQDVDAVEPKPKAGSAVAVAVWPNHPLPACPAATSRPAPVFVAPFSRLTRLDRVVRRLVWFAILLLFLLSVMKAASDLFKRGNRTSINLLRLVVIAEVSHDVMIIIPVAVLLLFRRQLIMLLDLTLTRALGLSRLCVKRLVG
jgi:hypothetical protein